jgi:transcriptional regulator with XRE-family HTH domain
MAKIGRPSAYSKALAERICERLAKGETLTQICKDTGYPARQTVVKWTHNKGAQFEAFRVAYAQARDNQVDFWVEEAKDIADDPRYDWEERQKRNGETFFGPNYEHIQRSRLRVETRLKLAALINPIKYGDKPHDKPKEERKLPDIVFAEVGSEPTSE